MGNYRSSYYAQRYRYLSCRPGGSFVFGPVALLAKPSHRARHKHIFHVEVLACFMPTPLLCHPADIFEDDTSDIEAGESLHSHGHGDREYKRYGSKGRIHSALEKTSGNYASGYPNHLLLDQEPPCPWAILTFPIHLPP